MREIEVRWEDVASVDRSDYEDGKTLKPCTVISLNDKTDIELRGRAERQLYGVIGISHKTAPEIPDDTYAALVKFSLKERGSTFFRIDDDGLCRSVTTGEFVHIDTDRLVEIIEAHLNESELKPKQGVIQIGERDFHTFLTHPLKFKELKIMGGFCITNPERGLGAISISPWWAIPAQRGGPPENVSFMGASSVSLKHTGDLEAKATEFIADEIGPALQTAVSFVDAPLDMELEEDVIEMEFDSYPKYIREFCVNYLTEIEDPTLLSLVETTALAFTHGVEVGDSRKIIPASQRMRMARHGHAAVLRFSDAE